MEYFKQEMMRFWIEMMEHSSYLLICGKILRSGSESGRMKFTQRVLRNGKHWMK